MDGQSKPKTTEKEHILAGISSAPSNAKIIQTASKMAKAFHGTFTALYVKTPNSDNMLEQDRLRLESNIRLAESLGATIVTVYGEDVSFQIAEYARLSGVTKIVIGRSAVNAKKIIGKQTLADQLILTAPNVDIHIIPDGSSKITEQKNKINENAKLTVLVKDLLISLLILVIATVIGHVFSRLGFTEANIITLYLVGVLVTSVVTSSRICWVASSIASVLAFNFLFTVPRFSLLAYDKGYPITFIIMLVASLTAGSLAGRMKNQAKQSSKVAFRTKLLFDANQLIQKAKDDQDVLSVTANQLNKLLKREIIVLDYNKKFTAYNLENASSFSPSPSFISVSDWVIKNKEKAGHGTEKFSNEKYLYLPIGVRAIVYGVIAVDTNQRPIDSFELGVTQSIVGECALALERNQNAREKELASVLAKNEQLRANLLRAISHDLRTPLTSILGNASNLISNGNAFDEQTKLSIYKDVYEDSIWLINLVENLLSVTRLEEGRMSVNIVPELVLEVVNEAVKHAHNKDGERNIVIGEIEEMLLAKMDARLIVQVLINLLDNAIKYTPKGSTITVTATKKGEFVAVSVIDDGDGIPDEQKELVFDMFYTGAKKVADSRRSLGLGLALCKSIITAHGGEITVGDNTPKGAVFTFTLPIGEINVNE